MFYTLPSYSLNTITIIKEEITINLNLIVSLKKVNDFLVIQFSDDTVIFSEIANYIALLNKLKEIT